MNIYIPIEIKVRELEGKTLLALVAAERGHTVILGDKSGTRSLAKKGILPKGILHNKSLTPSKKGQNNSTLKQISENGYVVTSQDEESGLVDKSYEPFARLRYSESTIQSTDKIFAWGRHDATALKKIYDGYSDRIIATGSPRVDFWRKDLHSYYDDGPLSEKIKKIKPFILISSNFSAFLNNNRFFDVIARLRNTDYFERNPEWEQHQYDNFAYQTRLIFEFIKLIRELSVNFPKLNILLRPHPVESVEGWKKALGTFSNVFVLREGGIGRWLKECELLIHNGCTTAIEAAAFGKPRIAYRPIPNPIEREIPNNISYQAFGIEQCCDLISKILNSKNIQAEDNVQKSKKEILDLRFANLNGKLAADRIVDQWELLSDNSNFQQVDADGMLRYAPKTSFKKNIKNKVQKFKGKFWNHEPKNNKLLNTSYKFPDFTEEELDHMLINLRRALDRFHNVKYKRFGAKSFVLYSE